MRPGRPLEKRCQARKWLTGCSGRCPVCQASELLLKRTLVEVSVLDVVPNRPSDPASALVAESKSLKS